MGDVLEQGSRGWWSTRPRWLRRSLVAVLVLLAAVLLGRAGLLSADRSDSPRAPALDRPPAVPTPANAVPHVVAREGNRLVRYSAGQASVAARLPAGLAPGQPLVAVETPGGTDAVLGVAQGELFRLELAAGRRLSRLGPAEAVFGAPSGSGEVFVLARRDTGARLLAVDARTGTVLEPEPFPGFRPQDGWRPLRSLAALNSLAVLLSRPASDGDRLAVAWVRGEVAAGLAPALQELGNFGRLLGASGDWVLVLEGPCPGDGCHVKIISLTRDRVLMRDVQPPRGWSFARAPAAGRSYGAVVPVVLRADPQIGALARLVPGGSHALLIEGSEGVQLDAGVIEEPDEDVYFALPESPYHLRVARWRPLQTGVTILSELPRMPQDARLVCVCG